MKNIQLVTRACLRLVFTAGIIGIFCPEVGAQHGVQTGHLSNLGWSQRFQPANISQGDYQKFRYTAGGEGWLGNSDFVLAGIFSNNGYINEATKNRLLDQIKGSVDMAGGYTLDLANVNVKLGGLTMAFGLNTSLHANAHIGQANTLGLLLRGNKPFAGQTVSDDELALSTSQLRTFSAGLGWQNAKLRLGGRLQIHQGVRHFSSEKVMFALFTDSEGLEVNLDADYALVGTGSRKGFFQFDGIGASLDLGAAYQISDKMEVDVAANGLGWMSWKGNRVSGDVNVDWEGISIVSLLEDSVPAVIADQVDSLKTLVFPDTASTSWGLPTGSNFRLGFRYSLSEKSELGFTLLYAPFRSGVYTPIPVLGLAYQHEVIQGLKLGGNAYFGGSDRYGVGAMATYGFQAGPVKVNLLAGSDNLLGILLPTIGRGMSAYGGLGVDF